MADVAPLNFRGYIVPDSYVLAIWQTGDRLLVDLELALSTDHPDWQPPDPSEQHCYRHGRMAFPEATDLLWTNIRLRPTVDPDGTADLGSIDYVNEVAEGKRFRYVVQADVGTLPFAAASAFIELTDAATR